MKISLFLLLISFIALIYLAIAFSRINKVFEFRKEMIAKVFSRKDSEENAPMIRSVSYGKMVFIIWKPLRSFYPKEFLKKIGLWTLKT